jgi:hypothetical protein
MSAWNKLSGNWSWEERDFTTWATGRFRELVAAKGGGVVVESIGEEATASVLFLHGKKRVGCEFPEVKLRLDSASAFKGTMVVPELSGDGSDCTVCVAKSETPTLPQSELDAAKAAVKALLTGCLATLRDELAAKVA